MYFNTTFLIIYRYDPTDDTWTELPPMNIARVLAGSVVYKDKIYVIGNCFTV
jgi:N-acetylneuraminic acid mutarotase